MKGQLEGSNVIDSAVSSASNTEAQSQKWFDGAYKDLEASAKTGINDSKGAAAQGALGNELKQNGSTASTDANGSGGSSTGERNVNKEKNATPFTKEDLQKLKEELKKAGPAPKLEGGGGGGKCPPGAMPPKGDINKSPEHNGEKRLPGELEKRQREHKGPGERNEIDKHPNLQHQLERNDLKKAPSGNEKAEEMQKLLEKYGKIENKNFDGDKLRDKLQSMGQVGGNRGVNSLPKVEDFAPDLKDWNKLKSNGF